MSPTPINEDQRVATRRPVPARAGIGLRAQHHAEMLERTPATGWLEVHSENYFWPGSAANRCLDALAERYPLSLHGVGLSLGSTDPMDPAHLASLRRLVDRYDPGLVSEHLCWSSVGGRFTNDLLPLPCTEEALRHIAARIGAAQDALGRQMLIENVSSYLEFSCSALREWEFLAAVATESGCAILLDVNNIYVSSRNHGFDADEYLAGIPVPLVREIHLAGHSVNTIGERELLIDTHSAPVCDDVWSLYARALRRFGALPTLIEWDTDIPALDVLLAEAARADAIAAGTGGRDAAAA
jgi:uncharacterized protein (UPF0276 family)